MDSFTLFYLIYSAKLGSQASIYFIWLVDSSSRTIAFVAGAVAVLAIFPFIHLIIHVFSRKPLSRSAFMAYLCFSCLFAILWFEPTQAGEQRVLPFAIVTTFDLLALLIFLFQRQIGRWQANLTADIEQGRAGTEHITGQGKEEVEPLNTGAQPPTPQSERRRIEMMEGLGYDQRATNRSGTRPGSLISRPNPCSTDGQSGGQASGGSGPRTSRDEPGGVESFTLRPVREIQELGDSAAAPQGQTDGWMDGGMDGGAYGFEHRRSPVSALTPTTIMTSDIHPVFRPLLNRPVLVGGRRDRNWGSVIVT